MSESRRRRRRWSWAILAIVLLSVGVWATWRPPLNSTEESLLGTWRYDTPHYRAYETYLPNRRFTLRFELENGLTQISTGSWRAADGVLSIHHDSPAPWSLIAILDRVRELFSGRAYSVKWTVQRENDSLRMGRGPPGDTLQRID